MKTERRAGAATPEEAVGLLQWKEDCFARSGLSCRRIDWASTRAWRFHEDQLQHSSGRFFSVAGIRSRSVSPELNGAEQPILLQPDIGILGWLLRRANGRPEILIQAKTEPGNVGGVQLAPTVQATESNYQRVHGGAPTPYLEYFLPHGLPQLVADSMQSEHGTRFLNKYNRNVTANVPHPDIEPASHSFRWWPVETLLSLLTTDFCVNTDARSALVCSDWQALCGQRSPFEGHAASTSAFGDALAESFRCRPGNGSTADHPILHHLQKMRDRTHLSAQVVGLEALRHWKITEDEIRHVDGHGFTVAPYQVEVCDREVAAWDQPLVADHTEGLTVLLCQRREGVLRFLLRGSAEIGFANRVQFSPSLQRHVDGAAKPPRDNADPLAQYILSLRIETDQAACRQSEEGGRFHHNSVTYRIAEIPEDETVPPDPSACWATLGEIYALLRIPGCTTNELRSALSLLLVHL